MIVLVISIISFTLGEVYKCLFLSKTKGTPIDIKGILKVLLSIFLLSFRDLPGIIPVLFISKQLFKFSSLVVARLSIMIITVGFNFFTTISIKLKELIPVLKEYINKTNRRITFEYILLKDINDTEEMANKLSQLLKGINCYVNLIPYNETSHIMYKKSKKQTILKFYDILKKNKINVTIRKEFGGEVMAACGQLRSKYEEG